MKMSLLNYNSYSALDMNDYLFLKGYQRLLSPGDGMGIPTVTSSRILKGQLEGNAGEETTLAMDRFPFSGMSKVGI